MAGQLDLHQLRKDHVSTPFDVHEQLVRGSTHPLQIAAAHQDDVPAVSQWILYCAQLVSARPGISPVSEDLLPAVQTGKEVVGAQVSESDHVRSAQRLLTDI